MKYYEYQNNGVVDIYSGEVDADKQPLNSSPWPPGHDPKTQDAYWDGCGWVVGKKFESISTEDIRKAKLNTLRQALTREVAALSANYPVAEVNSWAKQESDARQYLNHGTSSVLLLGLSQERNQELGSLACSIVEKADAYHAAYAIALGRYQIAARELDDAVVRIDATMLRSTNLVK